MAFDLHVFIGGICLFVPKEDGPTYVLMPSTERECARADKDIHPHVVRLAFDAGYHYSMIPLKLWMEHRPLEGMQLSFGGSGTSRRTTAPIPDDVIDVQDLSGGRSLIDKALGKSAEVPEAIESRLVLNSGCITAALAAKWEIRQPARCQLMAHLIRWTIPGVAGDSLEISAAPLRSAGAAQHIVTLHERGGQIAVYVAHVTLREFRRFLRRPWDWPQREAMGCLPSLLGLGRRSLAEKHVDGAPHFRAYYCAFKDVGPRPHPEKSHGKSAWYEYDDCGTEARAADLDPEGHGGSLGTWEQAGFEHTCMTGKTPPQT